MEPLLYRLELCGSLFLVIFSSICDPFFGFFKKSFFKFHHKGSQIPPLWMVHAGLVFLADMHLSTICQDLLSPCDGMHVCTGEVSVYALIRKSSREWNKTMSALKGFAHKHHVSEHSVTLQWVEGMCLIPRACTLDTHAWQHIFSMCSTCPYMADNLSQWEYAWSAQLLSLCKPGHSLSLIGSLWFCAVPTQSQKGQASIDAHITMHSHYIIL